MFILLDNLEKYIDHIDPVSAHDIEGINTPLTIEITIPWRVMDKSYRLLVQDNLNVWQEYTISSLEEYRDNQGKSMIDIKGEHSLFELLGDYIEDRRPNQIDARSVLNIALENTRWTSGIVDNLGLNSATFYRTNSYDALSDIVNTWGAEIKTRVVVTGTQITARYVDLLLARGSDVGRVITYDKDLLDIRKKTAPRRIYTALYGYGKGEAIDGGYGRRIDFADINGGKAYVENLESKALWGRNNLGGKVHVFGTVEFDDVEDKVVLKARTTEKLAELSVPAVTYETSIANLPNPEDGVSLGDVIGVKDNELGISLKTRVVNTKRNLLDPTDIEITAGSATSTFLDTNKSMAKSLNSLKASRAIWDRASLIKADGTIPTSALTDLLGQINSQLNASGGYVYLSETGEGLVTYDRPVDPTSVIQLIGGAWRIANSKLPDGTWDWTTVGTGDGLYASALVAGILKSADNSVWIDLDNGTFNFSNKIIWDGSTFTFRLDGGQTVEEYVSFTVVSTDVEYYLSTSETSTIGGAWSTAAPAWVDGKYMWSRTKVTYKNATSVYKPSVAGVCIAGARGTAGKGISSIVEYYYLSTSSSTVTGGSAWATTPPAWVSGKFMWTKTRITYTDATFLETTPMCVTGSQGPQGITGLQGIQGVDGGQGIPGAPGVSSYTHIAYATNITGTTGFSTTDSVNKTHVGMYVDSILADSNDPAVYNWTLIKGMDGNQGIQGVPGANGQTSYLHIAYATNTTGTAGFSTTDPTAKTHIGQYTDFTAADSTNPALYSWTLIKGEPGPQGPIGNTGIDGAQGIQGPIGPNGLTSYAHIAYATNGTGTAGFSTTDSVGKTYIGLYTDFTAADSTNPALYAWTLIKGADGSQGIQGTIGPNGLTPYLHIAYANDSTGSTGFSTTVATDKLYIGTYTDYTAADSNTPSDYTWLKSKGDIGGQGPQGIQGPIGITGDTLYTWLKYATSPTTGMSDSPTGMTYIGLAYNKTTPTESSVYADYTWSLIKGDTGIQGPIGNTGATLYTWIKYADTPTTGMSDSPTGKKYFGIAYNQASATKSVIYTDYAWSLTEGPQGIQGVQGISISSVNVWYYLSTSATALAGGTWVTTAPAWVNGKYMWSKVITTYSSGSPTESTPACITGAIGTTGTTGTGISSITEEYYLSTSKTLQAGGSWVTTPPTWSTGMYMWTRNKIIYSNPVSTVYTTALVDNAWEAINDIKVGGRNYFVVATSLVDTILSYYTGGTGAEVGALSGDYVACAPAEVFICNYPNQITHLYNAAKQHLGSTTVTLGTIPATSAALPYQTTTLPAPTDLVPAFFRIVFRNNFLNGATAEDKKVMLEKGTKASDWVLSQEDIEISISEKATVTDLNNLSDAVGGIGDALTGKTDSGVFDTLKSAYDAKVLADNNLKTATETSLGSLDSRVSTVVTDLGTRAAKWNFIETSVTMAPEGIFVGNVATQMGVLIGNERISFMDKGTEVAFISNTTMQITYGIFVESAIIGKHKISTLPGTDISVFTYVG